MSRGPLPVLPFLLALALVLAPRASDAQASVFLNSVGYGVTGAMVGALVTSGATCDDGFVCIPTVTAFATLGGGTLGAALGGAVSSGANRSLAEGRTLDGARLAAVSVGTVVGGATLGAVASGILIAPDGEGTFLGSDGQTFALFTLAGAGLGVLRLRRTWDRLTRVSVEARPTFFEGGHPGVAASVRF